MSWKHLGHYGVNSMVGVRIDYWVDTEAGTFAYGGGYTTFEETAIPENATVEDLPAGGVDELIAAKNIELD